MTNPALQPDPEVIELDTSRIYQFPRAPEPMNPITAEPVEYQDPPDAVLHPKQRKKRQGKGGRPKGSRNKKDIIAAAKRREQELAARAPVADAAPASTSNHVAGVAPNSDGQGPVRRAWTWAGRTSSVFIMAMAAAVAVGSAVGVFAVFR